MSYLLIQADARAIPLADSSVDCVVTSPPFWGLRDYGVGGQIGLEPAHDCLGWATGEPCGECWVCQMIQVFREARRVLKPWGTVWANLGDAYSAGTRDTASFRRDRAGIIPEPGLPGLRPKNLCGVPWRFALALQADGWWLRSEIIWAKPNPMPESVKDRPTKSHETIFLLTKCSRYFYDQDAVRVPYATTERHRATAKWVQGWAASGKHNAAAHAVPTHKGSKFPGGKRALIHHDIGQGERAESPFGRSLRTVWSIPPQPTTEAHFATFPESLVETCILAGTSARGNCPNCGRPWERTTERRTHHTSGSAKAGKTAEETAMAGKWAGKNIGMGPKLEIHTTGWCPTCSCSAGEPAPAVVLDPFVGSGTTCRVADHLGRHGIGLDLNLAYLADIAAKRCAAPLQPVLPGVA